MKRILCVGIATLDIVNWVERYPSEDSEVRASMQVQRMGGNAANTACVLAQLNNAVAWAGNLAPLTPQQDAAFEHYGVSIEHAVRVSEGVTPTSYITLSEQTGTRTIVHFRDLPEYSACDFREVDLSGFAHVHFEGRALEHLPQMLEQACTQSGLTVSLEVEKPRLGIEDLFAWPDLLMFSRAYAQARGFESPQKLLQALPSGKLVSCTWGAEGAWGRDAAGQLQHAQAPKLAQVVDSVGAGDVFNAGLVDGFVRQQAFVSSLQSAVDLASAKCAREGLSLYG